jgi:hypothetical protein
MPLQATYGGAGGQTNISKSVETSLETITAQDKDGKVAIYKVKYGKTETSIEKVTTTPSIPNLFEGKLTAAQTTAFEIRISNTDIPKITETKTELITGA